MLVSVSIFRAILYLISQDTPKSSMTECGFQILGFMGQFNNSPCPSTALLPEKGKCKRSKESEASHFCLLLAAI